jgi:hypothetical protein
MRQVCNVAFALQVQHMDEKEYDKFTRELERDPTLGKASHGTDDLMAVMMGMRQ